MISEQQEVHKKILRYYLQNTAQSYSLIAKATKKPKSTVFSKKNTWLLTMSIVKLEVEHIKVSGTKIQLRSSINVKVLLER